MLLLAKLIRARWLGLTRDGLNMPLFKYFKGAKINEFLTKTCTFYDHAGSLMLMSVVSLKEPATASPLKGGKFA